MTSLRFFNFPSDKTKSSKEEQKNTEKICTILCSVLNYVFVTINGYPD